MPDLATDTIALRAWAARDVDALVDAGNDHALTDPARVPCALHRNGCARLHRAMLSGLGRRRSVHVRGHRSSRGQRSSGPYESGAHHTARPPGTGPRPAPGGAALPLERSGSSARGRSRTGSHPSACTSIPTTSLPSVSPGARDTDATRPTRSWIPKAGRATWCSSGHGHKPADCLPCPGSHACETCSAFRTFGRRSCSRSASSSCSGSGRTSPRRTSTSTRSGT